MKSIIFYGAGKYAHAKFKYWTRAGLTPACFTDADISKHHTLFIAPGAEDGIEILPLFEAISKYPDYELCLTQSLQTIPDVCHYLYDAGIPAERIKVCELLVDTRWSYIHPQLHEIFWRLQDSMSCEFLLGRIEYSLSHIQTGLYRAMMSDDYMAWTQEKQMKSQKMYGLQNNIWQVRRNNFPVQKNDIYLIIIDDEYSWHVERFLPAMSGIGIKISGCVMPERTADTVDYLGIPRITEEELNSRINDNTIIIIGLPVVSSRFRGVLDKYSDYKQYIVPLSDDLLPQYFENDILLPEENEIFVDIGSYDFEDSINFHKWAVKGYEKIYAFEPDPGCYQKCLEALSVSDEINNEKVEIINKGLSYKCGVAEFPAKYSFSGVHDSDEKIDVEIVTLDEFLDGRPVTFVKMDVEGAELDVLYGMKSTIMRYRPKLAVCIYHDHKDVYEIMSYILSLIPEYKCYIRHYTSTELDEVLLCEI